MKLTHRAVLALTTTAIFALVCSGPVRAQTRPAAPPTTVIEIRVEGNKVLSESSVLVKVKTRPGQPYSDDIVRQDERRLLKTRRFESVVATRTQTDKGIIVTFTITERPLVEAVQFQGNKVFDDGQLSAVLPFTQSDPIDRYQIENAARAIQSKYRSDGYHFAEVEFDERALREDQRVVYSIVEGPKVAIRKMRFEGNRAFSNRRLKGVTASRSRFWPFVPGTLDNETVGRGVVGLRSFYRSEGFLDAQVDRSLSFSDDKKKAVLVFVITEGDRYRVRRTIFEGNVVFAGDEIARHLTLTSGAFYTALPQNRDLTAIKNLYGEIGYIETDVSVNTRYTDQAGLIDLVYTVSEGRQFRVGQMDIRGNEVTKMNVIRRQFRLSPGQFYNTVAAKESRNRLMETGLFESVTMTPYGEEPDVRNVLTEVTEAKTARFLVGAGVSSNAGLLGNVSYTETNFDLFGRPGPDRSRWRALKGGGQTLSIVAEPGTEFMRFRIDWREPYLFDKPYSLGVRAFTFTSARETYDETRYGGLVSLGHRFKNRWYAEAAARVEGVTLDNLDSTAPPDVAAVAGTTSLAGLKGTLVRDRTDSRWLPSSGDRVTFSYEQVVGDFVFGRTNADYRIYRTVHVDAMDRKHILATRAAVGAIFGDSPVFERFYGGGLGSVRGFDYRGISPRQGPTNEVVGGDFTVFLGSEYSFPIVGRNLRGVVFLDTGTVEKDVEINDYRISAGLGLRIHVPFLGPVPMSLDFAFPLSKNENDDTQVLSFSIGWVF